MKSQEFVYWLQGFFEIAEPDGITPKQVDVIKRHLAMVFVHDIDPQAPPEKQDALNAAHAGAPALPGHRPPLMRC